MARLAARAAAVAGALAAVVVGAAAPAQAHPIHVGVDPSDWRSTLTAVRPATPGVAVSLGDGAQRVTVTVHGRADAVVLGYADEPFVRITAHGVWTNSRSSTAWAAAHPNSPAPAGIDDRAPAQWRLVSTSDSWSWHDTRTHWPGYALPPPVQAHPEVRQQVLTWVIPVVLDGRRGMVTGRLDWVPGPDPVAGTTVLVLPLLLAAAGLLRRWRGAVATALLAVTGLDVAHSLGSVAGRVGGVWARLAALPGHAVISVLAWAAMLACTLAIVRRRHMTAALYGAAMLAAIVFLTDAVPSLALVWRSQAVTGLPVDVDRYLVAALTGGSLGLLVAAILLIRRIEAPPTPPRLRTAAARTAS